MFTSRIGQMECQAFFYANLEVTNVIMAGISKNGVILAVIIAAQY